MSERILAFEGVDNFRDYGDYATAAGRRIQRGRLLRSAHHNRATDADLQRMTDLNVSVVVDLRRASERAHQPSRRPVGFTGLVIESDDQPAGDAPHVKFLRETDLTEQAVREFMMGTYRTIPFDARHQDLFRRYFRALAETDGAVVIHCAAGKDRTGVLAALTHHLAGVSDEEVMEDYLLTNQAVRLVERAPAIAVHLEKSYGRKPSEAAVVAFLGVEADFLRTAFAEIKKQYGSLDAYLETVLGVDAALREKLEARLCG
jgi:protein-tyrosine phosphatase